MIQLHGFLGAMDMDSPDTVIQKGFHRTSRNIIFRGTPGRMRAESLPGTTLIANPFLPNTGTNKNIGKHYDAVNQRLVTFNYNSGGLHAIYLYYTVSKIWYILIQDGTNTNGDVLGFTASGRITSIDILYGDGNSGDLLFFVDSNLRPRKLNINRLMATYTSIPSWTGGTYAPIQDSFLKVIKAPPSIPPPCVYENDTTVTANNLLNSLTQIGETFIYDDFEESVLSTASKLPLPSDPFDPADNLPQTRNCRIRIYLQTGDQNVKKIRIYGRQTKEGVTTGWFIIDTLIKADLSIPDNSVYQYLFYNNASYIAADPKFTAIDQDFVPQQANCQALLDGTTISYAGIKEGYPFFNPQLNLSVSNVHGPGVYSVNGTLFYGTTNGQFSGSQPQIQIFLTGVGVNDGLGNPTTLEKPPSVMFVKAKSGSTDISFFYSNLADSSSISTLLSALASAAVSAGWVLVSTGTNSIIIYYPTGNVVLQDTYLQGIGGDLAPFSSPQLSFYPESAYAFGVVYRDVDGRTNGVISNVQGQIKMPTYNASPSAQNIPQVTINLSGFKPPSWAVYYNIVRTDTLTYQKHLYWVTNQAFDNLNQNASVKFAYLSISNMADYNLNIDQAAVSGTAQNVVSYSFSPGDRVRILGQYNVNGVFAQLNLDYAILGVAVNPIIDGITQTGTFLQIYYPTADIGPNFGFDGTDSFQNYQILIYSYKGYAVDNQNVYYAVGERYGIGNPGTNLAYHMGQSSDNVVNITDGDVFYRIRTVPIGNTYYIQVPQNGFSNQYVTQITVNPNGVISNASYEIGQQHAGAAGLTAGLYPTYGSADQIFWNKTSTASQLRFRGEYTVKGDKSLTTYLIAKVLPPSGVQLNYLIKSLNITELGTVQSYQAIFDGYVPVPANSKVWLIWGNDSSSGVSNIYNGAFTLRMDVIKTVNISIFEPSFSDVYQIQTNSDSQPDVINTSAQQTYFSTLFRFSQPYQLGTNINSTNRFFVNNFDEFDKSFGDVIRMRVRQRELRIFQYRRCGRVGVYQKFIRDNTGVNQLVTTDTIITPNNIQYFEGEYGIGNQGDSLCSSGYVDYFIDPVKGFILRLSLNGIEPISELYKVQTFSGPTLPKYLSNYTYLYGGNAAVVGCFNILSDREGEALFCVQAGTSGSSSLIGQTLAFNETKNAFTGFRDYAPDNLICCENVLYGFLNGVLYALNNTTSGAFANYFGVQYPCSITVPFNENLIEKKTFLSLTEISSTIWYCPLIYTDLNSYPGQRQETNLVNEDFALLENEYHASFLQDIHSIGGIINGNPMKGSLIVIQLQVDNPSNFVFLTDLILYYIDSRRNNK